MALFFVKFNLIYSADVAYMDCFCNIRIKTDRLRNFATCISARV